MILSLKVIGVMKLVQLWRLHLFPWGGIDMFLEHGFLRIVLYGVKMAVKKFGGWSLNHFLFVPLSFHHAYNNIHSGLESFTSSLAVVLPLCLCCSYGEQPCSQEQ
mmetsp:Transcript_32587/g.49865  ORF Transcript_32587/g.49865 Transcript_32587/m.49865 type:complete len:105 (+) Transcript_32587:570-884(+)